MTSDLRSYTGDDDGSHATLAKSIAERCRLTEADGDSIQSGSVICRRGA